MHHKREELAKQLSQNGGNVSLDMLQTTMGALAIILLISTLYGYICDNLY